MSVTTILQNAMLLVLSSVTSCPRGPECSSSGQVRGCSCMVDQIQFDALPSLQLSSENPSYKTGYIGMVRTQQGPFEKITYTSNGFIRLTVVDPEIVQECRIVAADGVCHNADDCGDATFSADLDISLISDSEKMRLTEPKPPGDPSDVTSIVITSDDTWWRYTTTTSLNIEAIQCLEGNWSSGYILKSGTTRLERVHDNYWRYSVSGELGPKRDSEDILRKYGLWSDNIRYSFSCECDIGSWQDQCFYWD